MSKSFLMTIFISFSLLLSAPVFAQKSCVTAECHAEFLETKQTHPTEVECVACHLGADKEHADGGNAPALKENMCVPCHDASLDYRYNHKPVTATTCHLCHDPHGEIETMLLSDCNFTKLFVDYEKTSYKLCFSCHKRDLLMFPDTSYSTDFRDGRKNLHYLHVNKPNRGRSCKLCHGVHGANLPKLMAESVSFGDWQMPVNFQKSETGGSCSPGCHEPRKYDRTMTGKMSVK